jgi:hypothetical protein
MAYSTPLTAVSSTALTAAQWNASVRDNILVTPAALATTAGGLFVATGANAIAQRVPTSATVATSQTTVSTTYTNLATTGPAVTVTTGTQAIVIVTVSVNNDTASATSRADFAVSGATTRAASDTTALIHASAIANAGVRATATTFLSLTAGSNTFTVQYRTNGGTGSFNDRHLVVIPL